LFVTPAFSKGRQSILDLSQALTSSITALVTWEMNVAEMPTP
jgi:hypothetical protein